MADTTPTAPRDLFLETVPQDFLENTVRLFRQVYPVAYSSCESNMRKEFVHNAWPQLRTNQVQSAWYDYAKRYDGPVDADIKKNGGKNYNHAEIVCGPVVWTAHAVPNRLDVVRHAEYRETLAREATLFPLDEPSDSSRLYAYLLHGSMFFRPNTPAFLDVVFPNETATRYVGPRIDLLAMVDQIDRVREEQIDDDLDIRPQDDIG